MFLTLIFCFSRRKGDCQLTVLTACWRREMRERKEYYAGIRRISRGNSFGKEQQKVIILFE